jgi:hypothetical protein
MAATVKTTIIQEPSSATVNLTLDTSGGVAVGQNLSVAGTTAFTGGIVSGGVPLKGSSSGTTTLVAASAASGTVTIPAGTGTAAVQGVSTNIVSGTAQASTSGTSIPFTGIPAWVKRITIIFSGVSTSGASGMLVRLGPSGGLETTGYISSQSQGSGSIATANSTVGFLTGAGNAINVLSGLMTIVNISGNTWVENYTLGDGGSNAFSFGGGTKTLAGALTQLAIVTANLTDTFDAGSINILYE